MGRTFFWSNNTETGREAQSSPSTLPISNDRTDTSPILAEHPALRTKIGRLPSRLFGARKVRNIPPTEDVIVASATEPSSTPQRTASESSDRATLSSPARGASNRTGRRPYISAWVREPARKRHTSNRVSRSYRNALKDKVVRQHMVTCGILAVLLVAITSLYVALAVTMNTLEGQEFHILLILVIIILAMFFFRSFARTCLLITRVAKYGTTSHRVPSVVGPLGYAQPAQPIPITLARDEELALEDRSSPQTKVAPPPPAYGLWRNSVRINPNFIHWQRVQAQETVKESREETQRPATAHRPPSYTSDNGVDYVIEAQPRSTVSHHDAARI